MSRLKKKLIDNNCNSINFIYDFLSIALNCFYLQLIFMSTFVSSLEFYDSTAITFHTFILCSQIGFHLHCDFHLEILCIFFLLIFVRHSMNTVNMIHLEFIESYWIVGIDKYLSKWIKKKTNERMIEWRISFYQFYCSTCSIFFIFVPLTSFLMIVPYHPQLTH